MNNKTLIGIIIAVCVILGGTFTSVVGYRSVESNLKPSPLFSVRSSRAIDEENKDIVCNYIGKGEEIELYIPKRDDEKTMILKFLYIVQKMDEKKFREVIELFNEKLSEENMINKKNPLTMNCPTGGGFFCSTIAAFGGFRCLIVLIISIPFLPVILPILLLLEILYAMGLTYSNDDLCFGNCIRSNRFVYIVGFRFVSH